MVPVHERIQQALGSIGALVLSDYAKGALTSVQTMIKLAREAGVPVLIDPIRSLKVHVGKRVSTSNNMRTLSFASLPYCVLPAR